jgi:hypothetical protein
MNPLLPALRPDLQIAESAAGINGAPQWVLADPLTGRYFTLTPTAIRLLRHWSLRQPLQILAAANQEPGLPLQVKELEQLLQFLRQHDLVTSGDVEQRQRYLGKAQAMRTSLWKKVLHQYLFFRIPLWRPDPILNRCWPWLKRYGTPLLMAVFPLFLTLGLFLVSRDWVRYTHSFPHLFSLQGMAVFGVSLVIAKFIHELGHAFMAKRAGCRVQSMGVAFIVLLPLFYTDVSDAWKLKNRRSRLLIGAGGILAELLLAVIALLVWTLLPDGPLRTAAFMLSSATWITTLVVNLNPESYSFDLFWDEFIGQLLQALPHPSLNYDRWLIELDPKEQKRREQFGEPPPTPVLTTMPERAVSTTAQGSSGLTDSTELPAGDNPSQPSAGLRSGTLQTPSRPEPAPETAEDLSLPESNALNVGSTPRVEIQEDLYGGESVISGSIESAFHEAVKDDEPASSIAFAATGLEPVNDIWHIPALQDDVEHLQDMAYRLVYELAEAMGCAGYISEDKSTGSPGFIVSESSREFALFLAGLSGQVPNQQFNYFMFCLNFIGSHSVGDTPVLDDVHVVKTMRLIRVIRRLRELQRDDARGSN